MRIGLGSARRFGVLAALVACAAGVPLVATSCRGATQVRIELSTDVPCSAIPASGAELFVVGAEQEAEAPAAVATACVGGGDLGSLVVVPSGKGDRIRVEARLALGPGPCVEGAGCIVARRSLRYAPHASLRLPIALRLACANVACDPSSTCVDGACRSADVDTTRCVDGICDESTLGPDGGVVDAGAEADAAACMQSELRCGGACVDPQTDKAHCGGCGVDCSGGECIAGVCRLVPTAQLAMDPNDDACIAVDPGTQLVYWTSNRSNAGHVYRVPRSGGSPVAADPTGSLSRVRGIGAGSALIAVGGVIPATTAQIFEAAPPAQFVPMFTTIGVAAIPTVARAGGDRCWTEDLLDGGSSRVRCAGGQVILTSPGTRGAIAVTQGTFGAALGGFVHGGTVDGGTTMPAVLPGAVAVAANPSSPTFYVAAGTEIAVLNLGGGALVDAGSWPASFAIGVAFDATTSRVYWLEAVGNFDLRARYREGDGGGGTGPLVKLSKPSAPVCLAVDDQALYFVSAGVPYKLAK